MINLSRDCVNSSEVQVFKIGFIEKRADKRNKRFRFHKDVPGSVFWFSNYNMVRNTR
uniref:Uncharacterized protein n=1 Tax=Anopheles albimanus TaxID=7167 RepID=A0A182FZJ8_ANOAL